MILITGATGFIGRSLRRRLLNTQYPIQAYRGEITDFASLRDALEGVDTVIHLAGAESRGRERWLARVDVFGTETLATALRHRPVQRLIYISRINADPHSGYPLLQAKGIAEQHIRKSEQPYTIIRAATLFGKDDRFTNSIATTAAWSWPVVWIPGGGTAAMQPLWVEDLARCIIATLGRPDLTNKTLTIAGDIRLRYHEIVHLVLEAANLRRRTYNAHPLIARSANWLTRWAWDKPPLHSFDHDRMTSAEVAPLDTVYETFGFRPARLPQHLAHLRRRGVYRRLFRSS